MDVIDKIKDDLKNYNKSYKFIVYKAFFELADNGVVEEDKLIEYFRDFYLELKEQGLKVETKDATSKITDIENSKFNEIKKYVERMPLDKVDYLNKEDNLIIMNKELWNQLIPSDIEEIKLDINNKIETYYKDRVGEEDINLSDNKTFLFEKKVNWSLFNWGITVPNEFHNKLYQINDGKVEAGASHEAKFLIKDREFNVSLRNVNRKKVDRDTFQFRYDGNSKLKSFLKEEFSFSYNYITSERKKLKEEEGQKRPQVNVPDDKAEYIKIYSAGVPYQYKIELLNNQSLERSQPVLRDSLNQILNTYYQARKGEDFAGHELGDLLRHELPQILDDYINDFSLTENNTYSIKGSIGQGNWARVPWLAIMDEEITTTTRAGVYVVYLFSEDMSKLYLTLNQGVTNSSKEEQVELRDKLRTELDLEEFKSDNNINLAERGIGQDYEDSTIGYIEYKKDNLPQEDVLLTDLKDCLKVYNQYKKRYINKEEIKKELSTTETITKVKEYIASQGYTYPAGLIENFYLSLKTKPFVLLAGISGTGKTKLVQLFAEAIGCSGDRFEIIPVRPDWSDGSDLLGYNNIKGQFNPGPLVDIINRAIEDQDNIYFICLDEMNLARVEYYFSDLLSVMETRTELQGQIKSDKLLKSGNFTNNKDRQKYAGLYLPENLYLVGTVNMDETTHPFSKKVLDRANTIEFSQVNLKSFDLNLEEEEPIANVKNSLLKSEYLILGDCNEEESDSIEKVVDELIKVNDILKKDNLHIGYRVRDEICFYMLYAKRDRLLTFDQAFDFQLMQKILPRIQGSSRMIKELLVQLFEVASGTTKFSRKEIRIGEKMVKHIKNNDIEPYPKSAEKLAYMTKRFEEDGFTAYWL